MGKVTFENEIVDIQGCISQKQLWSQVLLAPIEFNGTNDHRPFSTALYYTIYFQSSDFLHQSDSKTDLITYVFSAIFKQTTDRFQNLIHSYSHILRWQTRNVVNILVLPKIDKILV